MFVNNKIKKYPAIAFFTITFLCSWLFWIPNVILFGEKIQKQSITNLTSFIIEFPVFNILTTVGAAVPSIIAIILIKN